MGHTQIGIIHALRCCRNGGTQGKKGWARGGGNPSPHKDHLHVTRGNRAGKSHIEIPFWMRQSRTQHMRMFPPKHIIPAPINNPRDHLIKEVNNVSLTTNMTVKITTQEAISMARGHRTGRRELGIWHIGMRLTVGLHLNVGGGVERQALVRTRSTGCVPSKATLHVCGSRRL